MTYEEEERMVRELSKLTVRQLREMARSEGVCLGYAGATKAGIVQEIVSYRRHSDYLKAI